MTESIFSSVWNFSLVSQMSFYGDFGGVAKSWLFSQAWSKWVNICLFQALYWLYSNLFFFWQVAELKRTNNLYSDQDFYALKTIKIPVQQHGLLTETADKKRRPPPLILPDKRPSSSADIDSDDDKSDYDEPSADFVRTVSIRSALDSPNSFLQHMDNDLKMICKSIPLRKQNLDEVARTLTVNCINPIKLRKQQQEKGLGTACGVGWKGIIVVVFFVGILLPGLVAFLYLRKKDS